MLNDRFSNLIFHWFQYQPDGSDSTFGTSLSFCRAATITKPRALSADVLRTINLHRFFLPYHRAKLKSTFGCTDNDWRGHLHSSHLLKVRAFRDFALRLLQAEVIVTHCFLKGIHQSHLLWHWLPWLIKKASEDQHLSCHTPPPTLSHMHKWRHTSTRPILDPLIHCKYKCIYDAKKKNEMPRTTEDTQIKYTGFQTDWKIKRTIEHAALLKYTWPSLIDGRLLFEYVEIIRK